MDHKNAVELLKETFEQEFDFDKFKKFIKELFNHFKFNVRTVPSWKEYYDYVNTVTSLGVYHDNNKRSIEVFAIKLKKTSSWDRARTMQRNLIARFLTKYKRDAALVAFYGDDPEDWRFSFVKMEYIFSGEKGNWEVIEELTPAKRYSFLVGKNEPNHTCKMQFLGLIKEEEVDPLLTQIEEKFSIEKVTKDFYDDYKDLYLDLKESLEMSIKNDEVILKEFEHKIIKTSDFAKKLMGQIVFIYFLQKKGWLGVKKGGEWGAGPKKFLRKLFNKEFVEYDNFFNDVLEHLFYDALSSKYDDNYYDRFKCKIPFLNGGLFEPINDYNWKKTDIKLKNEIFEDILKTFDRYNFTVKEDEPLEKEVAVDPEMLGKVFENLLEIEDRKSKGAFYTPREVVHYMCQESLINYLDTNSEVDVEDIESFIRLGDVALGSIIKQQEEIKKYKRTYKKSVLPDSIKQNHEDLDKLLCEIKVVDPAVGSGAFPVGMMNEIIRARTILSLYSGKNVTNYDLKLETIENCLYGVDIDSSAVDIAKLRFWLSLIVDEEDMDSIDPLPNLDHKIICGNSLLEEFEGNKLFDENLLLSIPEDNSIEIKGIQKKIDKLHRELGEIFTGKKPEENRIKEIKNEIKKLEKNKKNLLITSVDQSNQFTLDEDFRKIVKDSQLKLKDLKILQKKFFKEQDGLLKKKYRDEIDKIEWEFIDETLKEEGNEETIFKLKEYKKNKSKPFFLWRLYFSEVFQRKNPGFDVVIANPPYIGEKGHKELFLEIKSSKFGKKYYKKKMDYFYYFLHKAIDLSRDLGEISFITTNYFVTADGAILLRKDIKNRTVIQKLINFNELKIFDSAKGQHNIISILRKGTNLSHVCDVTSTNRTGYGTSNILSSILSAKDTNTTYFSKTQNQLYDGDNDYIRLSAPVAGEINIEEILEKIKIQGDVLKKNFNVNQGLRTGADKLTKRHINLYNLKGGYEKGEGIFVLTNEELKSLNLNNDEKDRILPLFKNSDITQYHSNKKTKYNFIDISWPKDRGLNIESFPNIYNHLKKFKVILENRRENANGLDKAIAKGIWWPMSVRRRLDFTKEKIIAPQRSKINKFGYNSISWHASADVYFITRKDEKSRILLKYILALLNSKTFYFWLYHRGKRKGDYLELYATPLSEIPIKEIEIEKQNEIISLVDVIITLKKSNDYSTNSSKKLEVKNLKNKIDNLIFDIYGFNEKEKTFIINFYDEMLQKCGISDNDL